MVFGYSWNLFYPPFSTYAMLILKTITFSYVNALKLLVIISVIVSGFSMYSLVKEITKSRKTAVIASIFYMALPYRITDIYVRMAIGEILAFAFIPIVFLGLYNLFEGNKKKNLYITIGAVGLLLSHNISTLLTVIIAFIYVLFNIKKLKDWDTLKKLLVNALFICLIVSFFYLPLLEAKISADYASFEAGKMGSPGSVKQNSVYLFQLLFGKMQSGSSYALTDPDNINKDMCISIGLFLIVPLLFTPFVYKKIKKERRKLYLLTLITGVLLTICVTPLFPWEKLPNFVGLIQHPFRLMLIITFLFTIISAINIEKILIKVDYKHILLILLIIFIYIGPLIANTFNVDINFQEGNFYNIDTMVEGQESSQSCAYYEYLPTKAEKNRNYIVNRSQEAIALEGKIELVNQKKENGKFICDFTKEQGKTVKLELPYIYYPGYTVKINGNKVQTKESSNGFVEIELNQEEKGSIEAKFEGTLLSKITWYVSVVSFVIFIAVCINSIRGNRNDNK